MSYLKSINGHTINLVLHYILSPQSNGLAEQMDRQLKALIMVRSENNNNSMDHLPMAMSGFRSAWRTELDCSTAELVYGTTLTVGLVFDVLSLPICFGENILFFHHFPHCPHALGKHINFFITSHIAHMPLGNII